jgi:gentisate 1,2-dioxygenase
MLSAKLPEKLIHKRVETTNLDQQFSTERKHPVFVVDLSSIALSMTIGGLNPGQSTNRHRHTYETIIFIIEGKDYTLVEDRRVDWEAGDAIYVPVWAWHQHFKLITTESCRYIASENAPLLQNLGGISIREES